MEGIGGERLRLEKERSAHPGGPRCRRVHGVDARIGTTVPPLSHERSTIAGSSWRSKESSQVQHVKNPIVKPKQMLGSCTTQYRLVRTGPSAALPLLWAVCIQSAAQLVKSHLRVGGRVTKTLEPNFSEDCNSELV